MISLVVHGHFYQPPRENPWTDELDREPTAAPAHDWNVRIHDECYRPNAFARIHGHRDRIRTVVNNYGRLSFNFGPTLARWIERHDPWTHRRLEAGDRDQVRRLGRGGALAQVWGHPIAPLLAPVDRRTQILWGLQDFARRFGRPAEGMWLPETAADPDTLEALIDAGVSFTILAPEQIAAVRQPSGAWSSVTRDTLDTGRAYRWVHRDGSGRWIALAVFDGPMSREVAFGAAAGDAEAFLRGVEQSASRSAAGPRRLVLVASDGELYGHHKKFADLTLAYALAVEAEEREIAVTNLAAFLAAEPPTWEARLAEGPSGEGTAWSCGHGLGRWQRDCGCSMRPPDGTWSQAWRGPLRAGLDRLRDRTHALFEDLGTQLFCDPWGARDAYGEVIDAPLAARHALLADFAHGSFAAGDPRAQVRALTLLETMRSALLMYASCGWFFDDIAGVESALVLRQAAYVLDGWEALGTTAPVEETLDLLARGRSNLPAGETGADVLRRVRGDRVTSVQVAAATVMAKALDEEATPLPMPGHDVRLLDQGPPTPPRGARRIAVTHLRTGEEATLTVLATPATDDLHVHFADHANVTLEGMPDSLKRALTLRLIRGLAGRASLTAEDAVRVLQASRLVRPAGAAGPDPELDAALLAALARVVSSLDAPTASVDAVASIAGLVADLNGALGALERTIQEWVGERLEADADAGREATPALRNLAESVGFGLD